MTSFHNKHDVHNQAGQQTVHGDINYYIDSRKREKLDCRNEDADKALDDAILASLAFPEMLERRSNVESPHPGTCRWISDVEVYQNWKTNPTGLLWIKGKPGAGKSTLMSHLYHEICLESSSGSQNILLEFFFSARGAPLQHSPLGMLQSLLNQLFYKDRDIRNVVREVYKEKCARFGSRANSWSWQRPELERIFRDSILSSVQSKSVTLFVDALDEAGEQAAREVARYFHFINDRITGRDAMLKICMSCRHYPIVSNASAIEICMEDHNSNDIKTYLDNEVAVPGSSSEDAGQAQQWRSLMDLMNEMARGVFQWVCLIVPMVNKYISDGDSPQLITRWLSEVPLELRSVYTYILEHVIDHRHIKHTIRLFQWTCLSCSPVTVTELRYMLATEHLVTRPPYVRCEETRDFIDSDAEMTSRIRTWSGGLIEVGTDELRQVQVVHQSVDDFYQSSGIDLLAKLDQPEQNNSISARFSRKHQEILECAYSNMYWSCLKYMATVRKERDAKAKAEGEKGDTRALRRAPREGIEDEGNSFGSYLPVWRRYMSDTRDLSLRFPLVGHAIENTLSYASCARAYRSRDLEEESQLLQYIVPCPAKLDRATGLWFRKNTFYYMLTAFHVATAINQRDLALHMLAHNIDVDTTDCEGDTALHSAARRGDLECVKFLVNAGANHRTRGALHEARRHGYEDIIDMLRKRGLADFDDDGRIDSEHGEQRC